MTTISDYLNSIRKTIHGHGAADADADRIDTETLLLKRLRDVDAEVREVARVLGITLEKLP